MRLERCAGEGHAAVTPGPGLTWLTVAAYMSIGLALLASGVMLFDLLRPSHARRWPLYAAIAVLGWECIVCFFAASDEWTEQWLEGTVVGIYSVHARFAIELGAIGALNLLASILLLLRQWRWVWWLAIGMQLWILALALIETQLIDPNSSGWSVFSRFPLLSLFLLLAFRLAEGKVNPATDRVFANTRPGSG